MKLDSKSMLLLFIRLKSLTSNRNICSLLNSNVVKKIVKDMKNRFNVNDLQPEYRAYFQKITHKSSNNYQHSPQIDKVIGIFCLFFLF